MKKDWIERIEFKASDADGDLVHSNMHALVPDSLAGKRVLDASCVDGYWALEALRRGALEVVALPAEGLYSILDDGTVEPSRTEHFEACRLESGSGAQRMRLVPAQVYSMNPQSMGTFDCVLFLVNVNQVRHLLFALDSLRSVCRGEIFLGMNVCGSNGPDEDEVSALLLDDGPFWLPTLAGLKQLLKAARFEFVTMFEQELDSGHRAVTIVAKAVG